MKTLYIFGITPFLTLRIRKRENDIIYGEKLDENSINIESDDQFFKVNVSKPEDNFFLNSVLISIVHTSKSID